MKTTAGAPGFPLRIVPSVWATLIGAALIATLAAVTGCARADRPEPIYGWMLEQHYPDGPPVEQQVALSDHRITRSEVEAAATHELACLAAIDGVEAVDPYNWQNEIDFVGGGPRFADGADEGALSPAIEACYYEHLALVYTAWLDQEHFGSWTGANLAD